MDLCNKFYDIGVRFFGVQWIQIRGCWLDFLTEVETRVPRLHRLPDETARHLSPANSHDALVKRARSSIEPSLPARGSYEAR